MKYTTLLMDADDTIFDFPRCEAHALKDTLTSFGLTYDERIGEDFSRINSALWKQFEMNRITRSELRVRRFSQLLEQCFAGFEHAAEMADKYVDCLSTQTYLIDGAQEALKLLSRYYEIDIITNGLKKVQRGRFARTPVSVYCHQLYISDEMGVQKPSRAYFDLVLADLAEQDHRRILVVGDSLTSDMQGGRNAGLDTCLYDPKERVILPHPLCDYRVTDLTEIVSL